MQSWGTRSRFDDRDTHPEPTKSGVLGLVCAALGRSRQTSNDDLNALLFGVRVDAPGTILTDFHTAQGVVRAAGAGTSTVTSHRHFVADARFLAGLQGEDLGLLRLIEACLHDPVWTLALGRRSFPPALPPYIPGGSIREGTALLAALKEEPWRPLRRRRDWDEPPTGLRIIVEDAAGEDGVLEDVPLSYSARRFGARRIRFDVAETVKEGEPWCS
jgi:CRISPR system Cascade subunit CasD